MSTPIKYLLFQLPGWVLVGVILTGLRYWAGIPGWTALGLFLLWVAKDLVMYPLLRTAYESGVKTGAEQLIGTRGVAYNELSPRGYVRVRGELWQAEVRSSDPPVPPGSPVRVLAADGMTLIVKGEKA
ncbi:MAG: NfeD family protein [Deltaproteobacteria bacterium]|nr:NfeD family protein [Deltaproteobacteria bacterium]